MEKYIHIKSKTKCIVSLNGTKAYHISKEKPLDLYAKRNSYVSIYPEHSEFLPYTFSLADIKQNDNILKVDFPNHTELYFTPTFMPQNKPETVLVEKKYGSHYVKISTSDYTYLNITNGDFSLTRKLTPFQNCKCDYNENLVILGTLQEGNTYVMIFDLSKNKIIFENEVEIVEKEKDKIKFMKNTNNLARHGIVYEYDTKSKDIDNYAVYIDNNPHRTNIKEIVPYAFLESIKLKDYNLARSYLLDTFVTNEHLSSYFGDFDDIFFDPYSKETIYGIVSSGNTKCYRFELANDKIKDIEQI